MVAAVPGIAVLARARGGCVRSAAALVTSADHLCDPAAAPDAAAPRHARSHRPSAVRRAAPRSAADHRHAVAARRDPVGRARVRRRPIRPERTARALRNRALPRVGDPVSTVRHDPLCLRRDTKATKTTKPTKILRSLKTDFVSFVCFVRFVSPPEARCRILKPVRFIPSARRIVTPLLSS